MEKWLLPLGAILVVAALVALLLVRAPDSSATRVASTLVGHSQRLGQALSAVRLGGTPQQLRQEQAAFTRQLAQLDALLADDTLSLPELAPLRQSWANAQTAVEAALRAPSDVGAAAGSGADALDAAQAAVRTLEAHAATLSHQVQAELNQRRDTIDIWLKGLMAALAALLLVPLHGLWRQRQHMRSSLHEFSDELGSGTWREAVDKLREDRAGAPSAFDALASGVETVLGESDRRWQALADLSADWYWETDASCRLSWLSGSAPELLSQGASVQDLLGRRHDQIPLFKPPAQGWAALHACMARLEAFRDVEFEVASQRQPVWVSISGRPRFDAQGKVIGYEGVGRDVSERKSAHQRLVASEQRWSMMARLAADWYWQTDAEHRLLPLSAEQQRRIGDQLSERIVGRTRWVAHRDALTAEQWAEHRADLDARRPFRSLQLEAEVGEGRYAWISLSGVPRFDAQRRFVGYHGVGRDISTRKEAERLLLRHNQELKRAVDERTQELQQLNLDLDAFARQLAHELRTPIGQVQGLAAMLADRAGERLSAEERELLALQQQAARGMRDTLEALTALAHASLQPMPHEDVDLSTLAHEVLGELPTLPRCSALRCVVQPGVQVHANPAAMKIVLANLLGNAAKFSRDISDPQVHLTATDAGNGQVCVRIEDNGAGFDAHRANELFRPFSRLHGRDAYAGSGIGLSIVQRIVERHGGTVAARGSIDQGACFEFTLKGALQPATEVPQSDWGDSNLQSSQDNTDSVTA